MRVLLNGREIGGLDSRLERRLWGRRTDQVVEAVTISPEDSIAARSRELLLLLGGASALVAVLLALNLFIVVAKAPEAMGYVQIFFGGAVIPWLMQTCASILRGTGNMKLPSALVFSSAAIQITLGGALALVLGGALGGDAQWVLWTLVAVALWAT